MRIRLTWALVDQWMASYEREPASVILDIDDTCDVVHGHQQLSLFNAHYDERCFLPIHVYDTERSRPVAVVLRSGKTPSGVEVRAHLRRLVRHIRQRWTRTRITFRGDGHYARSEAMEWCEVNHIDYVFGLPGSKPLAKKIDEAADAVRTERALSNKPVVRGYAETRHKAKSWSRERRAVARIEATPLGLDTRFVVTNVAYGAAEWIYAALYCARVQAENLIKLHKTQLASDRTSCRSAIANQVRLALHTAAYWLMLTVRDAIPKSRDLANAEFSTLRTAADPFRRPRHRNRKPRPSRFRRRLPGGRPLPRPARSPRPALTLHGAAGAPPPLVIPPTRSQKYRSSGGDKAERTRAPRGPKSRVGAKSQIVVIGRAMSASPCCSRWPNRACPPIRSRRSRTASLDRTLMALLFCGRP